MTLPVLFTLALSPFLRWLNEDVAYIIAPEERAAFSRLTTDDERRQFIEQFWLRRDPTPETPENEYKDEHYRRIAYANARFGSAATPGWKTDRGHAYIACGPPAAIESHDGPVPFEKWRYRFIEGIGTDIILEFVDAAKKGEFALTMDPVEREALFAPRNPVAILESQMGSLPRPARPVVRQTLTFPVQTPAPHVRVEVDYMRLTGATTLAKVTVQIDRRYLRFVTREGVAEAAVNVKGRVTAPSGAPVDTFEDMVRIGIPEEMLPQARQTPSTLEKQLHLAPGTYRLTLVVKGGGSVTNSVTTLDVPRYDDEQLGMSTPVLKARDNPFFGAQASLRLQFQLYNLGGPAPNGSIAYNIVKKGSSQCLYLFRQELASLEGASAHQVTVEKDVPLWNLPPGEYTLRVRAIDRNRNQTVTRSAAFAVP